MAAGVAADALSEEWKGYVVQINGGKNNVFPRSKVS